MAEIPSRDRSGDGNRLAALLVGGLLALAGAIALAAALGLLPASGPRPKVVLFGFAALALPAGGLALVVAWRAISRDTRLRTQGIAADARVTAVTRNALHINGQPRWRLAFRYSDAAGNSHEAEVTLADRAIAEALRPGDLLVVRYAAADPGDCLIADFAPRRGDPGS